MNDNDFWDEKEKKYMEENENKRKMPSFILLILFTTVGIMFALGLSFSALNTLGGNETINTIISNITGNDNTGKYIITYSENLNGDSKNGLSIINGAT